MVFTLLDRIISCGLLLRDNTRHARCLGPVTEKQKTVAFKSQKVGIKSSQIVMVSFFEFLMIWCLFRLSGDHCG